MKKFLLAIVMAILCIGMTACTPMSVEKAEEKMQKAGYLVVSSEDKEAEGLVGGFVATKNDGEGLFDIEIEMITAFFFETTDAASDFYSVAGQAGAVLDGKWVYWGTEDAIEDFTALFNFDF